MIQREQTCLAEEGHATVVCIQGCREDWRGPGQIEKVGPHKMDCVKGVWGHAPRKF